MTKLVIKVLGVVFLITFLIYLFYSPRLKFDVLENPNNNNKISHSNQVSHSVKKQTENPAPKNGIGTWIGKDINLSLIHISEPTRREWLSRMPSSA